MRRYDDYERADLPGDEPRGEVLPTPTLLAQYEAIVPGSAERLLRLAEEEAERRHGLEQLRLANDARRVYVTLGLATALCGFGVLIGLGMSLGREPEAGMAVVFLSLLVFATVFIVAQAGRRSRRSASQRRLETPRHLSAFDL